MAPAAGRRLKPLPFIHKRKYFVLSFVSIATPNHFCLRKRSGSHATAQKPRKKEPQGLFFSWLNTIDEVIIVIKQDAMTS